MKSILVPLHTKFTSAGELGPSVAAKHRSWSFSTPKATEQSCDYSVAAIDDPDLVLFCSSPDLEMLTKKRLTVNEVASGRQLSEVYEAKLSGVPQLFKHWVFVPPHRREVSTTVIDWRTGKVIYWPGRYSIISSINNVVVCIVSQRNADSAAMVGIDSSCLNEVWRDEGYFLHTVALPEQGVILRGRAPKRLTSVCDLEIVDADTGEVIKSTSIQFGPVCAQTERFLYFISDGCIGELNLESLEVRKIETGFRCAKDFQILDERILFQVPDEDNCEGGGCLYLQDIKSSEIVGRWAWPSMYDWARATHVESIGEGYYGIHLRNGEENRGWSYWRYFVFKPKELMEADPQVEYEPLMVSFAPEKDENGDNRYRVSVSDHCDDLVTYIWQMEVGAHSCADVHGFSGLVEDKPFDEDFAGEVILDCRNIPFDGDKESLGAALVESGRSFCSFYQILDAVDHEPIRFRCEF